MTTRVFFNNIGADDVQTATGEPFPPGARVSDLILAAVAEYPTAQALSVGDNALGNATLLLDGDGLSAIKGPNSTSSFDRLDAALSALATYLGVSLVIENVTVTNPPTFKATYTGKSLTDPSPFRPGFTIKDDLEMYAQGAGLTVTFA